MTRRSAGAESRDEVSEREIVINQTRLPILRAGLGHLLLPMTALLASFGYLIGAAELDAALGGPILALLGLMMGLAWFACCTARIARIPNDELRILRSFDEIRVPIADVEWIRCFTFRPSGAVVVKLVFQGRRLPVLFHFVVMSHSSVGNFDRTVAALRTILQNERASSS